MNISPSCDVDNYADFAKYYMKSYMLRRDGTSALYVASNLEDDVFLAVEKPCPDNVRTKGHQVLRFADVKNDLVFSRDNGRLMHDPEVGLFLAYMYRNKSTARGFRPENYQWMRPQVGERRVWRNCDPPHAYVDGDTHLMYSRLLLSKPLKLWFTYTPEAFQGCIVDDKHSVFSDEQNTTLYWLTTPIGKFSAKDGVTLYAEHQWRLPVLAHLPAFKGVYIR